MCKVGSMPQWEPEMWVSHWFIFQMPTRPDRCDTAWTYANIFLVGVGGATMLPARTKVNACIICVYKSWPYKVCEPVSQEFLFWFIYQSKYLVYLRLSAAISKRRAEVLSSFSLQKRRKTVNTYTNNIHTWLLIGKTSFENNCATESKNNKLNVIWFRVNLHEAYL